MHSVRFMVWAIFGTRFLFLLSSFPQSLKRLMSSPFINQLSLFLQWILLRYLSTSLSRKKSKSSHVPGEPWEHHLGEVWQFFLATQRKERFCVGFFFFGGGGHTYLNKWPTYWWNLTFPKKTVLESWKPGHYEIWNQHLFGLTTKTTKTFFDFTFYWMSLMEWLLRC